MDICYLSVKDVRDVELGRLTALRKVIYDYPRIEEAFIEYVDYGINDMSSDEINTVIHEFAKEYGIKILRENLTSDLTKRSSVIVSTYPIRSI